MYRTVFLVAAVVNHFLSRNQFGFGIIWFLVKCCESISFDING